MPKKIANIYSPTQEKTFASDNPKIVIKENKKRIF